MSAVQIWSDVIGRCGSGYIAWPLIGQNKGTLRTPADLSRVSHLQVYKCTEAGLNSCITSNYRSGNTGQEVISYIPLMPLVVLAPGSTHTRPSALTPIDISGILSDQL